jgi:uncharacterized membrane protein (DUF485 family)
MDTSPLQQVAFPLAFVIITEALFSRGRSWSDVLKTAAILAVPVLAAVYVMAAMHEFDEDNK